MPKDPRDKTMGELVGDFEDNPAYGHAILVRHEKVCDILRQCVAFADGETDEMPYLDMRAYLDRERTET
jgi:hypothetical protein